MSRETSPTGIDKTSLIRAHTDLCMSALQRQTFDEALADVGAYSHALRTNLEKLDKQNSTPTTEPIPPSEKLLP